MTAVAWAPACLFWARFNKLLAPFLQWVACGGELVLQWGDASVRDAVAARYQGAAKRASSALFDYFQVSSLQHAAPRLPSDPTRTSSPPWDWPQ